MSSRQADELPFVGGTVAGIGTWLLGYALTYVVVAPDIRESALNRFLEAFQGEPATYEMVGWVFYNAHFVETVYQGLPVIGSQTASAIGGDGGFSAVLYAIPVAMLFGAGLALSRYQRPESVTDGAVVGITLVPAYLVLSLLGAFLFEVSIGGATGGPDLLPAILVAGIVYPTLFAGGGGALGSVLEQEAADS